MKRIGLIGGLSPESTIHYYQALCHEYNRGSGGLNFPEMVIVSLNLQDLVTLFDTTRIHAEAIFEFALREQTAAEDKEEPPEPFSPVCYLKEFKHE